MNATHEQIALEKAVAGMILVDNLNDLEGNLLLSRGTTLTEATLMILRRRRIRYLHVQMSCLTEADANDVHDIQLQRLVKLFRLAGTSGASGLLLRHLIQYRLDKNRA
ncbi:MAG: hypothetical protein ABIT70_08965 [Sulfuriferula sp.]